MRKIIIRYKGLLYGELEILQEDFAKILRALGFKVVEDVEIPETDFGAKPKAMEEYCRANEMTFVEFWVHEVPFYYAVKELWAGQLLDRLNLIRKTEVEEEWLSIP